MFSRLSDPLGILYTIPAILLAMMLHELAHALTADKLGDPTPRNMGRITLDPFAHVDWVGLIMFVIMGFGWARPVTTRPSNYKNPRTGSILVSVAGPLSNFIWAFVFYGIYAFLVLVAGVSPSSIGMRILAPMYSVNLILAIFNLIPIPPLDGYHVLTALLPPKNMKFLWTLERYGWVVLIVLSFTGIFGTLLSYVMGFIEGTVFGNFYTFIFSLFG